MFTGIIEELGRVKSLRKEGGNLHLTLTAQMATELKIDQSVSHNGVCLTVVGLSDTDYTVTAIEETLNRTNLGQLQKGDDVNLERGMKMNDRLDGHIVQGHVDQTATCTKVEKKEGSHVFHFYYGADMQLTATTIPKGSITINGVSLTVVDSTPSTFSVAIIPYTFAHTTFKHLKKGDVVNLEFDVIGKYVARLMEMNR